MLDCERQPDFAGRDLTTPMNALWGAIDPLSVGGIGRHEKIRGSLRDLTRIYI